LETKRKRQGEMSTTKMSWLAATVFNAQKSLLWPSLNRGFAASAGVRQAANAVERKPKIFITGSLGQLGSGLATQLRKTYGSDNVIMSDIRKPEEGITGSSPFVYADVLNYSSLEKIIVEHRVDWIIHFSALLSAIGELYMDKALAINNIGFQNIMELAKVHKLKVFCPSTIGAFGPTTPRDHTPDLTIMRPTTIYGITKVHMELLGEYYNRRFGVDFRSLRYPGVISADTAPGGGTTDYAVDIFHQALKSGKYTCFLSENTRLPMMYLPDCLKATVQAIEVPRTQFKQCVYNLAAFSFTPKELANAIKKRLPHFEISYAPDFRQQIADSWPMSLDDSNARKDWSWKNDFSLDDMVDEMLRKLAPQYKK